MARKNWLILSILGVVVAGYYYAQFSAMPTPGRLSAQALFASDDKERQAAAVELAMLTDPAVLPEMRRVAADSKDAVVLAVCLGNLANRYDRKSLPVFVANLENESLDVRQAAYSGVLKTTSIAADKYEFQPAAPPDKRGPAVRLLTEECRQIQEQWANPRPLVRTGPAVAVADTSAKPPAPIEEKPPATTKDDAKDPAKQAPPATTPAPFAPAPAQTPGPQVSDYPAERLIFLLAWTCRVLGLLMLLAEVVGAFNMVRAESRRPDSAKKKNRAQPAHTAAELSEKMPAGNSASSEISRLFKAVVSGVAMLLAGEMVLLAARVEQTAARVDQTAIRMEQKLDHLSRSR